MKDVIYTLLTSKKFLATLVAAATWLVGLFGLDAKPDELLPLIGSLAAYVLAQGFADYGKEAAKVNGDAEIELLERTAKDSPPPPA